MAKTTRRVEMKAVMRRKKIKQEAKVKLPRRKRRKRRRVDINHDFSLNRLEKKANGEGQPVEEVKEEPETDELPPKIGKRFIQSLADGKPILKERAQDNSHLRLVNDWKEGPTRQT